MKTAKLVLLMLFIAACSSERQEEALDLTKLSGEYLGQAYPLQAETFLEELVGKNSSFQNLVFSNDGKEFYYTQTALDQDSSVILVSSLVNDAWTTPKPLSFIDSEFNYTDPFLSSDANTLYFVSDKPVNEEDPLFDYSIWYSKKNAEGWETPKILETVYSEEDEYYPSLAENDNIYFSSAREGSEGFWDIYMSRYDGENYLTPARLDEPINSKYRDWDPFIAPDESYILFVSDRPGGFGGGDIYVSFKDEEGKWGEPKNLGGLVNTNEYEYCPKISYDGKYLFFTRLVPGEEDFYQEKGLDTRDPFEFIKLPEGGRSVVYWLSLTDLDVFEIN